MRRKQKPIDDENNRRKAEANNLVRTYGVTPGEATEMLQPETLDKLRFKIREAVAGGGEHWHHLVRFNLTIIANKFGKEAANKVIRDLKLDKLGWTEQK